MTSTAAPEPTHRRSLSMPVWIRHIAPVAAVIVLAIPFIRPFLTPEFPDGGDGLLNLYRVMALDFAIQHGDLWPRFATALHFGFGSPAFNYYAPLSLYGVELFHLIGLDFADAYRAAVIGYALLGALGAYLLGRAALGWGAGIIAAVGFLYAPPIFDTFNRLGQFAAVMLLPWVLWAFWRLATRQRRRDVALAVILFAALLLTHNVTALYAAPLAALWAIMVGLWAARGHARRSAPAVILPGLALILALGLTAFFWWPALAEAEYVQLDRLNTAQFDTHNNFLPLTRTFAPPVDADTGRIGTAGVETIGWVQLALGAAGAVLVFLPLPPAVGEGSRRDEGARTLPLPPAVGEGSRRDEGARNLPLPPTVGEGGRGDEGARTLPLPPTVGEGGWGDEGARLWVSFAAVMVVLLIFFTTRASVWLWDHLPLVDLLLFPSRLLFGVSLLIAVLAGIGAALVARRIASPVGQAAWIGVCAALMIGYALPGLHTQPPETQPVTTSLYDLHEFERQTGWIGATSAGEFLPVTVKQVPHSWALTDRLLERDLIARLQPNEAISVQSEAWGLTDADLTIHARQPTTLVFEWFYFPGWEAEIDGRLAELRPTDPEGLIALDVPEGEHRVSVSFERTPVRRYAEWASLLSVLGLAVFLAFMPRLMDKPR